MDVGIFEGRNRFSELIDAAQKGETITVMKHGKPVARIVPVESADAEKIHQRRAALEAVFRGAELIAKRNGRIFTHQEIISARDEGRR
jgi:prevent-host-death family protein